MNATQKMKAFGFKALAEACEKDLVTIYRWRRQLVEDVGIHDGAKRLLIQATAGTQHAIKWEDFAPEALCVA